MCARYFLFEQHYRAILRLLGVEAAAAFLSRYNLAPGAPIPAIRSRRVPKKKAVRELAALHWGLVPSWAKEADGGPINARSETLMEKPSFRDALVARRCIIPASGFYEWEERGRIKQPWAFRRRDEQPFGLAGLWEQWRAPDGSTLESCAVITTAPNELMAPIHHRMPVMLRPDQFDVWLDHERSEPGDVAPLMQPAPADTMTAVKVGRYVSNVHHEGQKCLEPAGEFEEDENSPQLSLGI